MLSIHLFVTSKNLKLVSFNLGHSASFCTAASSTVVVQHKAGDTRAVVTSRQVVARLLTAVMNSLAFVHV